MEEEEREEPKEELHSGCPMGIRKAKGSRGAAGTVISQDTLLENVQSRRDPGKRKAKARKEILERITPEKEVMVRAKEIRVSPI